MRILGVLHVEPARLRPLSSGETDRVGEAGDYAALSPLLWELALRGARETLLPEIAGPAAYRVAPGSALHRLGLSGSLQAAVEQLRQRPCNVAEIASWPGFDRERATRLLNGLYLHAALIVSRTHPALPSAASRHTSRARCRPTGGAKRRAASRPERP